MGRNRKIFNAPRRRIFNHNILLVVPLLAGACSESAPPSESAEDFARRIHAPSPHNAENPAPADRQARINPDTAEPATLRQILPFADDKSGDPRPPDCGAPLLAEFMGQPYTKEIGQAINNGVPNGTRVRVLPPGSLSAVSGRVDRLNVMLDHGGNIKDIRCG